jgi:hypothetical protein
LPGFAAPQRRDRIALVHFRRLACLLLGAWLAAGFFMAMVATQNFRSVDRLLAKPSIVAAQQLDKLGPGPARALLRYQVSEQNRWYFETWGFAEIILGVALFSVLLFGSTETKFSLVLSLLMLLIALAQRLMLTPEIVALGRLIDFLPAGVASADRARFWMLHTVFSGAEVLKWVLGLIITVKLLIRTRRRVHATTPAKST